VQQRHTADVLWLEAWRAVLWPNPFAHLLLPALRLTHELLADAAAAPATGDAAYPTLLARLAARQLGAPSHSALLQPFTFSFTLTRIAMLQNQNPVRRWKQWLVLPALGGLFLEACQDITMPTLVAEGSTSRTYWYTTDEAMDRAAREVVHLDSMRTNGKFEPGTTMRIVLQVLPHKSGDRKQFTVTITRVPISTGPSVVIDRANAKPLLVTSSGHKVYAGVVEQLPQLLNGGGELAIADSIQSNIVYPKVKAGERLPAGRLFARFVVDTDGTVQNASIIKSLHPALDEAALAAIKQLPRFQPGQQGGQAVAVSLTLPVFFQAK
jgi:TonB family protein